MIVLDTHIWVWWVHGDRQLIERYRTYLQAQERTQPLGVSIISCWEIAKLVEYGRLTLPLPLEEWLNQALHYPGIRLLDLTTRIVVESTQLPGDFHRDPGDQLIVPTARVYQCPLVTMDGKMLAYPHVEKQPS